MSRLVALLAGALACGPSPEAEAPASEEPPPREDLDAALAKDGADTCEAACERLEQCPSSDGARFCRDDCGTLLGGGHASPGLRYASCLNAMSCEEILRAVGLAVGPIGRCFVEAERMGR
jgi:hypothetical protein